LDRADIGVTNKYIGFEYDRDRCRSNLEIDKAVPFYFHQVPDQPNIYKLFACIPGQKKFINKTIKDEYIIHTGAETLESAMSIEFREMDNNEKGTAPG
jgi:hypothetical protein